MTEVIFVALMMQVWIPGAYHFISSIVRMCFKGGKFTWY